MSEATVVEGKKKTEYTPIVMSDGRTVEFAGKRKMLKDPIIEKDGAGAVTKVGVRFDFRNGNTMMSWIPDHKLFESAAHGWGQKLGDTVAGMKNEDGTPADVDDIQMEVEGLNERLQTDGSDWNVVKEGGGFGGGSILLKALIEYSANAEKPQTAEHIRDWLKTKDASQKMALRDKPSRPNKAGVTLQDIIAKLEAAKKSKVSAVDTEALMAELEG